jgi:hypothetical protein
MINFQVVAANILENKIREDLIKLGTLNAPADI